jgi:hypothetical protein
MSFPVSGAVSYQDPFDSLLNSLEWIESEEFRSNIAFMVYYGIPLLVPESYPCPLSFFTSPASSFRTVIHVL